MQRHDAIDPEVSLLDVLEQVGGVGVDRRARAERVDFDEDAIARQVGHQHRVGMRITLDVIQHHGHGVILVLALGVDGLDDQALFFLGQRVGLQRVRPLCHRLNPGAVAALRDHGHTLGDRRAQPRRVIEMMVRGHQLLERLARHGFLRLGKHRERARLALRSVDQHQVIVELDEHAVMRLSGEEPHALADRLDRDVGRGRRRGGAFRRGRRREVTDLRIRRLFCGVHLPRREVVDLAGELRRQLEAAHILILAERRRDDDVTQVGVVRPRRNRQRHAGGIDAHGERRAARGRNVALAHGANLPDVADCSLGIHCRAHERQRVVIQVGSPIELRLRPKPRGRAGRVDVVGDRVVQALDLFLRLRALEVRKLRRARLLDPLPSIGDVDLSLVARHRELLRRGVGLHVLPEVVVRAFAFDGQGLDGLDAVPATQGRRASRGALRGGLRAAGEGQRANQGG